MGIFCCNPCCNGINYKLYGSYKLNFNYMF